MDLDKRLGRAGANRLQWSGAGRPEVALARSDALGDDRKYVQEAARGALKSIR